MTRIGVLVARAEDAPGTRQGVSAAPAPKDRTLGRAALALAEHGIAPIFIHDARHGRWDHGRGTVSGAVAHDPDTWLQVSGVRVSAVYDRFPSRVFPTRFAELVAALRGLPIGNPPALMSLCQDKLASHHFLREVGIATPEVEWDASRFDQAARAWGAAFLKPRFGTAGRGIARVVAGQPLPERSADSPVSIDGPRFLQRAIEPLEPWRGMCVRVAAQRSPDLSWHLCPAVARYSAHDWVVNAARGSEIALAQDVLPTATQEAIRAGTERVCDALAARPGGAWMVEVGLDWLVDRRGDAWLLELNSRPLGRLAALAGKWPEAFAGAHLEACMRPLRFLAARAQSAPVPDQAGQDQEEG